jgi:hypothetical protein
MIKSTITRMIFKSIVLVYYCLIIASCEKESYPSVINLDLGQSVIFDATEEQIIRVDANSFKIEFEIVSIINSLCPEGVMCFMMGNAILTVDPIFNMNDLITLSYPSNENISDSVQFTFENQNYIIQLLSVKKEFYNKRKTKTKSVVELKIDRI